MLDIEWHVSPPQVSGREIATSIIFKHFGCWRSQDLAQNSSAGPYEGRQALLGTAGICHADAVTHYVCAWQPRFTLDSLLVNQYTTDKSLYLALREG